MHHAHLQQWGESFLENTKTKNADMHVVDVVQFDIALARELITVVSQKSFALHGGRTVFVRAETIRVEAQNALLKILEDPPHNTQFFFQIKQQHSLLPTLLSRFNKSTSKPHAVDTKAASDFITLSLPERLALVLKKTTEKDTVWYGELLSGLEALCLENQISPDTGKTVLFIQKHIANPGSSPKMLFEHLALSL